MKFTVQLPDGIYAGELKKVDPVQYYRVPHDREIRIPGVTPDYYNRVYMGDGYNSGEGRKDDNPNTRSIPEVYRMLPDMTTPLECRWIKFWWGLNPDLALEQFENLLDNHWAFTNNTGWPGSYNCLTGEGDRTNPPNFHAPLLTGGALLKGIKSNGRLYLDSLQISMNTPDPEWVMKERPYWWFYATQVAENGNVSYILFKGKDGNRYKVRIPILTKSQVYIPIDWLDTLPLGFIPPDSLWTPT